MSRRTYDLEMRQLQEVNPFRPLDWRFLRVADLVTARKSPSRWDDRWIREYARFYELAAQPNVRADQRPLDAFPYMYEAFRLRHDLDLRAIVEAFILAGETDEQIAQRYGFHPESVGWYEAMYFHVRDRLESVTWVLKSIGGILGSRPPLAADGVLTREQIRLTWKVFGYYGGPSILEAVLGVLSPGAKQPQQIDAWIDQKGTDAIKVRSAIAAYWLESSPANALKLLRLARRLSQTSREAVPDNTKFAKNISAFLDGTRWLRPEATHENQIDTDPKLHESDE
jgi:hypothetical protein